MPSIATDSSVLYVAFDATDRHHRRAVQFLAEVRDGLVTNPPVLTEVSHMLRRSGETQRSFLRFANSALGIDGGTGEDLPRIVEIMAKYSDLPADFADAALLAMCERLAIETIASFDKDFLVYRLANGATLQNVLQIPKG